MFEQIRYPKTSFVGTGIKSTDGLILIFAIAFFPRVIAAVGVPSIVNFLHFPCVLVAAAITIIQVRTKSRIRVSRKILLGLCILLMVTIASALLNGSGVVNVILSFLLQTEPFLFLLAILGARMSLTGIERFRFWLLGSAAVNLLLAYFQYFILGLNDGAGYSNNDNIKGVFLNQGAGHHVGGAVALTAAVYVLTMSKPRSVWLRALIAIVFTIQTYPLSDSKQVIAVFLGSLLILTLTKFAKVVEALQYLLGTIVIVYAVYWAILNLFPTLVYWLDPDLLIDSYGAKFSVFSIMESYHFSFLNSIFGLGPGHTIGRLGWLIPDYSQYLQPLGVTSSPVTAAVFAENDLNPLTNEKTGSSMFSLTFSWAGIWGDLGFLGLAAYLYLWFVVWSEVCQSSLSKFFVLNALIFGGIFAWLEEPGYMLFVICVIGVEWQQRQYLLDKKLPTQARGM